MPRTQLVDLSLLKAKVLIYCNRGRDRSPFTAMLYVSKRYGLSYQEAYALVKSKRRETAFHWDWVRSVEKGGPASMKSCVNIRNMRARPSSST